MEPLELEFDGCTDNPDTRDYAYEEYFWAVQGVRENVINSRTEVQNQWTQRNPSTAYACTCFGISHCINEANVIADEIDSTKGEDLWSIALKNGAGLNSWWSLQGALDLAMSQNHISGYTRCETLEQVIDALNRGQLVYTGSNSINFRSTAQNGNIAVRGQAYGHCFAIFGYLSKDRLLICKNSYWPEAYDKGYFYVKYDDFDVFFSKYAIVDKEGEKNFTEQRVRNLQAQFPDKLPSNQRRAEINDLNAQWKYKEAYDLLKYCLENEETFES